MGSMKYHAWWFWHRFRPRALWAKLTTYRVPVYVSYNGVASSQSSLSRSRWDKGQPKYIASVQMRCADDTEWHQVDGVVLYEYDDKGRLSKIGVGFDRPCTEVISSPFYLDAPYLGD